MILVASGSVSIIDKKPSDEHLQGRGVRSVHGHRAGLGAKYVGPISVHPLHFPVFGDNGVDHLVMCGFAGVNSGNLLHGQVLPGECQLSTQASPGTRTRPLGSARQRQYPE